MGRLFGRCLGDSLVALNALLGFANLCVRVN